MGIVGEIGYKPAEAPLFLLDRSFFPFLDVELAVDGRDSSSAIVVTVAPLGASMSDGRLAGCWGRIFDD